MGYSGTPMVTITNNRNLLSKRNKLFDLKGLSMKAGGRSNLNTDKFQSISTYDAIQKEKRTNEMLSQRKKAEISKSIFSVVLLSIFIISAYYILPHVKWLIVS